MNEAVTTLNETAARDLKVELNTTLEELAHYRFDGSQSDIATSLEYLSHLYVNLGDAERALEPIKEAVKLRRDCSPANPTTSMALASSLQYLAQQLSRTSRLEEAIISTEEAITTLRLAKGKDSTEHLASLSACLHNLGFYFGQKALWKNSLEVMEEAVQIRRELAYQEPSKYNPLLAASLHNLGFYLHNLGRPRSATTIEEESAKLRRDFVQRSQSDVTVFGKHDLAESLHSLSGYKADLGRHYEAAALSQENLRTVWGLAWDNPTAYSFHLATALHNSAAHLHKVGRSLEAITEMEESIQIRRDLAKNDPSTHLPHLAHSLNTLNTYLFPLGRKFEAATLAEEAISLYRDLNESGTCTTKLAFSLFNLAIILRSMDRGEEALKAAEEAVRLDPSLRLKGKLPGLGNVVRAIVTLWKRILEPALHVPEYTQHPSFRERQSSLET
ncbi:hypothetical protein FRB96_003674 [Tulasnella sp. 330]|nr:hypothetical protein FRB96_003674 [Tulasnella sp. 330]